jgi:hypothetical protein
MNLASTLFAHAQAASALTPKWVFVRGLDVGGIGGGRDSILQ